MNQDSPKHFFVLDIGTRFVRGLVCRQEEAVGSGKLLIVESGIFEHETRAMRAGHIHDIDKVTKIVKEVKDYLQEKLLVRTENVTVGVDEKDCSRILSRVSVAVAGRNLITCRGFSKKVRKNSEPINAEEIRQLEFSAVQNALESVAADSEYFCVGYSASVYRMDGEELSNLIDHMGTNVETEVLVTLLPRHVLEGMFAVTKKLEVEIDYLTLEPIAALESAVSENMKSLNLILIDIGAGTSDIAVVSKGRILAYGMVAAAGDMITETISGEYLTDFHEAERIKRNIRAWMDEEKTNPGLKIKFRDIFDRENEKTLNEILEKFRPAVKTLSELISREICRLSPEMLKRCAENTKLEDFAVVLVGGGSSTPFIDAELSTALNIPKERIGLRPVSLNKNVQDLTGRLSGPDAVTATGIALLVLNRPGLSLTHITLNNKRITAVSTDKNPNVLSVLLSQGINIRQIYGRPGLAKSFSFNGKFYTIKGELPQACTAELNGRKVPLDFPVKEGDAIMFYAAVDGKDASKKISEAEQLSLSKIKFNGKETFMPAKISVNGTDTDIYAEIIDRCIIEYSPIRKLGEILKCFGVDLEFFGEKAAHIDVDGSIIGKRAKNYILKLNGAEIKLSDETEIAENDKIEFEEIPFSCNVKEFVNEPPQGMDLRVKINGEEYVFPGTKGKIFVNGKESGLDTEITNGDVIRTKAGKDAEAVLVDVFRYISIDPQNQLGKKVKLLINGQESQFTSPLCENADIKVLFE